MSMPSFRRSYDAEISSKFQFIVPPECPVFEPTIDEFDNPIRYINSIASVAEKYGICKIKPPADWQPPFAMDVDNFKFVPRVQRLNELEAQTRIKLNFLDQISKYWQLQGIPLKIPTVEGKILDLYELYHVVQKVGGLTWLEKRDRWGNVMPRLGLEKKHGVVVRGHYMKILHPYHIFRQNTLSKLAKRNEEEDDVVVLQSITEQQKQASKRPVDVIIISDDEDDNAKKQKTDEGGGGGDGKKEGEENGEKKHEMEGEEYKPHGIESRQAIKPPTCKSRRTMAGNAIVKQEPEEQPKEEEKREENGGEATAQQASNKELKRLSFFGAGPKLPGYDPNRRSYEKKTRGVKVDYKFDSLEKYRCKTCQQGENDKTFLFCDGCDDSYHTHCLVPPLKQTPEGDWRCPACVALEVGKPAESFGFEQATREYTLQQFGDVADSFKKNYFRMPVYTVPTSVVEKEYWRIVSRIDEDVTVQYGADLHTMDHGSGFPTSVADCEEMQVEIEYSKSPWNLNNLPVCDGSVLQFIDSTISGMKVPWMYVGMCFATFCWHNEDHWNYSINYLHWGEPKTWYGVPGNQAAMLEDAMKEEAPELFNNQPDLLQQLVTIMNPNILMKRNVTVVRTDQRAGEFVVTFPRAYHAGFNQGYNFAEAVNFAPASWIKIGRECIEHYRKLRRVCVFAHDELLIRMAEHPERLNKQVAMAAKDDMVVMCREEKKLRKELAEWGTTLSLVHKFESLKDDDDRVCEVCKTTTYLSGVTCKCMVGTKKHVCLKHYRDLCACPPQDHVLLYRHDLNELLSFIMRMSKRVKNI